MFEHKQYQVPSSYRRSWMCQALYFVLCCYHDYRLREYWGDVWIWNYQCHLKALAMLIKNSKNDIALEFDIRDYLSDWMMRASMLRRLLLVMLQELSLRHQVSCESTAASVRGSMSSSHKHQQSNLEVIKLPKLQDSDAMILQQEMALLREENSMLKKALLGLYSREGALVDEKSRASHEVLPISGQIEGSQFVQETTDLISKHGV